MSSPPEPSPPAPSTLPEALARLDEAENTLRAIGAGEVDAFVVSDGERAQRVFTLATADRPYRMFVENMRDGAATLSPCGVILYANRRLAEILRCSKEALVGTPLLAHVIATSPWESTLHLLGRDLGATLEFDLVDADGASVPVLVGSSPLEVDGDDLLCVTFTDMSAQKAQESEIARLSQVQGERMVDLQNAQALLMRQATHDALTGLPNRALLVDRIDQALAQARRSGRCVAVLFVDLDGFKTVNDTRGHAAGDRVLCTVAERLATTLRRMDTVARVGGDEFAILAPEVVDRAHALDISARLMTALSEPGPDGGQGVRASVGMTVSVAGRGTAEALLYEADTAMYQAKSLGGQRVDIFDVAFGRQLHERAGVRRMLESALDDRRVLVHYQPIVDLPSGRVAGFEALARIRLAEGAILSPADFIPVAESTGLILPLGTQVLELACQQASEWQDHAPPGSAPTVAVNLSARQLEPGDLTDVVQQALEVTGLSPTCLHLELTETATFDLRPALLRQLRLIADLGVQIGLDDFGTGYASLTHLRRLPVTFVKIDQSFVQGMATDQEDGQIVSAVVDLAANLGLRSIAEGVETQAQMDRLQELGCDQVQGYLFARPMPAADLRWTSAPSVAQHVRR